MTKANVLITGGSGFIGSHVVEVCVKSGYNVHVLKRQHTDTWRIAEYLSNVTIVNQPPSSYVDILTANNIDSIIHLATDYSKSDKALDVKKMLLANVVFPAQLAEAAKLSGVKFFINTGTYFEFDFSTLPINERSPRKPFNFYASSKISFESILKNYTDDFTVLNLKLFSPYGERDNEKLINYLIRKCVSNETIEISEGFQKLDLVYVKDIAKAYDKALSWCLENSHQKQNHDLLIGSGITYSIRDIIDLIRNITGSQSKIVYGSKADGEIEDPRACTHRAGELINWSAETPLINGLEKTIDWIKLEVKP